jgi:hypothetical protein
MKIDSQVTRTADILTQNIEGTVVLLKVEDGQCFTLEEVGSRVWDLCETTTQVSDIVAAICAEYEAPRETVEGDVIDLLSDFAHEGLIAVG